MHSQVDVTELLNAYGSGNREALDRLMPIVYARQAEAMQHCYFGELTNEETAEALGTSLTTVERDRRFGRAWLARAWSRESLADL